MRGQFVRIWQFRVRAGQLTGFLEANGPRGRWAQLFRRGQGYLGTELLELNGGEMIYVTIDRWESEAHWQDFRRQFDAEYAALDRECEHFTDGEEEIGSFHVTDP